MEALHKSRSKIPDRLEELRYMEDPEPDFDNFMSMQPSTRQMASHKPPLHNQKSKLKKIMNFSSGHQQTAGGLIEQSLGESNDQFLEFESGQVYRLGSDLSSERG